MYLYQIVKLFFLWGVRLRNAYFHFELYLARVLFTFFTTTKYYFKNENIHSLQIISCFFHTFLVSDI